jgi:rhamnogalacturonan acetylesterase
LHRDLSAITLFPMLVNACRALFAGVLVVFAAGTAVAAPATEPAHAPGVPTLWIVGDSTVHNQSKTEEGWGEELIKLFDPAKVRVINRAMGGRSSRTFQTEGRWDSVLKDAQAGDFVIIQMGHNDGGALSGDNRERGTIRGVGEEGQEVTLSNGKKELVHTYGWYMRKYVSDARAKGMTPIICSWIPHCPPAGKPIEAEGEPSSYRAYARDVAAQEKVSYIDLYALTWHKYMKMTAEEGKKIYFTDADNTHTTPAGAQVNAQSVVEGLKQLTDLQLAGDLKADAR